jgi:predicted XRE-type DNA-binding protein
MKKTPDYQAASGNVFADIGLPNAQEHLVKAQLVYKIDGLLKARGLKQVAAAKLFGVKQPDVSKMLRGDFRQFSVERLLRFLVALGQDVEIVVKPHRGKRTAEQLRVAEQTEFERLEDEERKLRARIHDFNAGDRMSRDEAHERDLPMKPR